jgi:hypothetical protein
MKLQILENLKHIVTHIGNKLKLFEVNKTGRPLKIKKEDALAFALYKQRSTRATKKSVYDDFKEVLRCSYKTFVVSLNNAGNHLKYTDATDIPVCLLKNSKHHKTMYDFASWGHSGKGFYFGLKLTITRDDDGRLLNICFSKGNGNDRTIFRKINKNINGIIVADAGYCSKELEKDMYIENKRWCLIKPYKTMKKLATVWQLELYKRRFKIEFDFRDIKLFHGLCTSLPRSVDGYIGNYLFSLLSFVLK